MINKSIVRFPGTDYHNPWIVTPLSMGHEWQTSPDYRWNNQRMEGGDDYYFIQYTLSGEGGIRYPEKEWRLEPQTAFLNTMAHPFEYWFDPALAGHWEFLWLGMRGESGRGLFESLQKEFGRVVHLPEKCGSVNLLRDFLERCSAGTWKDFSEASTAVYGFLVGLAHDLRNRGTRSQRERIDEAVAHLRDHCTEPLDISIISPRFGYTREHFTRIFRKRIGLSPGRFLQDLRLRRACELLRATDLSLDRIAQESGLRSANYLCRTFRTRTRMTPLEYRQSPDAAAPLAQQYQPSRKALAPLS